MEVLKVCLYESRIIIAYLLPVGFKGQARVILPTITSCIECQLDMHAPRAAVPLCTLATIPRQPQHCIEWAHIIAWEEERKGVLTRDESRAHANLV